MSWVKWLSRAGLVLFLMLTMVGSSLAGPGDDDPRQTAALPADGSALIYLTNGVFDPLQAELNVPAVLRYTPEQAEAAGVYLLQFSGPVLDEWKQAVEKLGAQIGPYIPDYAFIVRMDTAAKAAVEAQSFVRWVGVYQPAYKLAESIDRSTSRSYRVLLAPWADGAAVTGVFSALDENSRGYSDGYTVVLNGEQVDQAAYMPDVLWIEPLYLNQLHNDVGGGTIMGGTTAWASGYTGSGVTVAIADTGIDTGVAGTIHQDFAGRIANIYSWPVQYADYGYGCATSNTGADDGAADKASGHGSHVAGSVAGSGAASGGQLKGLAYQASIVFQATEQYTTWTSPSAYCQNGYTLTGIPDDVRQLLQQAYTAGARTHNNSWGGGTSGVYDTQAGLFDNFLFTNQDFAVTVSAGNSGTDANNDGYVDDNSVKSPAASKNVITIGASDNERSIGGYSAYTWTELWGDDFSAAPTGIDRTSDSRQELAAFSSRGPMNDGRIKPDLVAPGTNILSVRSSLATGSGWGSYNTYYMYMGGTSMASPLSSGAAALVRDYYIDGEGHANPSAALVKATLINSAVDISGYGTASREAGLPIPNNHEGWGLIDVGAATTPGAREFVDNTSGLSTGGLWSQQYTVSAGKPFKVTLVWSDKDGTPSSGKALVNDLNLRVTAPGGTVIYLGNRFTGGWSVTGGSADTINNVENVYVQSPTAGSWKVEVLGANIPTGPQRFALVIDGNLGATALPPTVSSITPNRALNNATLQDAVVRGANFTADSTVSLVRGTSTIPGANPVVNVAQGTITADFNLSGAAVGWWNVRVVNSAGTGTLTNGFQVQSAALPDLRITKTAQVAQVDPGSPLAYTITINNAGGATATTVVFTDTLPAGVTVSSLAPACTGGRVDFTGGFRCQINGSNLAAGSSIVYTLNVNVGAAVKGVITNRVTVASAQTDGYPADNTSSASVTVGAVSIYLPLTLKNWPVVIPTAPVLNPIANADLDGSYVVAWNAVSLATSYTLQEDDNNAFSSPVTAYSGAATSWSAAGKANGTYYYRVQAVNAGGSSAWSNIQSVVVAPPAANPIVNGNFESGPSVGWTEFSTHGWDVIVTDLPGTITAHSGIYAAWLGGEIDDISYVQQQVTIPIALPFLTYYHWIASEDECGFDFGGVMVNTTVVDVYNLCMATGTGGWVKRSVNLSAYAGQTVTLQIRAETDGAMNSNLIIDDVAFAASAAFDLLEPEIPNWDARNVLPR